MIFFNYCSILFTLLRAVTCIWEKVPCDVDFVSEDCDFEKLPWQTVEDFEKCAPALLTRTARNYFLGAAGRRITYNDNKEAFKRIKIVPKMFRDVSVNSLAISTLGQKLSFPICISPVAFQNLVHPLGEIATVRGMSDLGTVMILSNYATTTIEEVSAHARGGSSHLWMQVYIFKNRTITQNIIERAERAGFKAIVVIMDSPVSGTLTCNARSALEDLDLVNMPGIKNGEDLLDLSVTFKDITWVRNITNLPVVAKGILSASDAVQAIHAGANAVLVSNHGGRQMDCVPATIDVLPDIVDAVNSLWPRRDVYVDSGIRNGWDVYKAIASGAKMVFVGRPIIFGLAKAGEHGVREVLSIIRKEFEEVMLLAGASNPSEISRDTLFNNVRKTSS